MLEVWFSFRGSEEGTETYNLVLKKTGTDLEILNLDDETASVA